mgnify:CR=1 FL=1
MFSGDRADGRRVRDAPKIRLFMPYLMPTRGESVVYMKQKIDVSDTQAYLDRWNDGERPRIGLYHIYVAAAARMLGERPRSNRFIVGRRLYQRNDVAITMSVLKSPKAGGTLTTVKQIYDPKDGLTAMSARTDEILAVGRSETPTASEREVALITRLPRWLIPLLPKLQKLADWLNVTPASLAANDPLYASLMISHNGSVGLDSVYHHLYEHGTIPIFAVLGPVRNETVVTKKGEIEIRPIFTVRYTLDERVTEGHHAARAIRFHKRLVESPWLMETPEDNGPGQP